MRTLAPRLFAGFGSIDDAANFRPLTPGDQPSIGYHWLGEALYSHGYQAVCHVVNGELACEPDHLILNRKRR